MAELNVEALAMSRAQIRDFAKSIRKALGLERIVYVDIGVLLEFILPKVLPNFTFDVRSREDMGSNHGLADPDGNMIVLREDVYEGSIDGKGRDRSTVLHELAHVLMHKSDRLMHRRAAGPSKTYCDPEWQAKAFAGEFLVPCHLIGKFTSVAEVAKACGVSRDAAKFQLQKYLQEGLIEKGQIKDLAF